jgi:hypothetical protein
MASAIRRAVIVAPDQRRGWTGSRASQEKSCTPRRFQNRICPHIEEVDPWSKRKSWGRRSRRPFIWVQRRRPRSESMKRRWRSSRSRLAHFLMRRGEGKCARSSLNSSRVNDMNGRGMPGPPAETATGLAGPATGADYGTPTSNDQPHKGVWNKLAEMPFAGRPDGWTARLRPR